MIIIKKPSLDVLSTLSVLPAGGDHYAAIDDYPDYFDDYVYLAGVDDKFEDYRVEQLLGAIPLSISSITLKANCWKSAAGDAKIDLTLVDASGAGPVSYPYGDQNIGTTEAVISAIWEECPWTNKKFTTSNWNLDVYVGMSLDVDAAITAYVNSFWVEISAQTQGEVFAPPDPPTPKIYLGQDLYFKLPVPHTLIFQASSHSIILRDPDDNETTLTSEIVDGSHLLAYATDTTLNQAGKWAARASAVINDVQEYGPVYPFEIRSKWDGM